jgi:uncharacterized membrane protein YkgB
MKTAQEHADDLKNEATFKLNDIFHKNNLVYSFSDVERIVECIISASILTVAALQSEAIKNIGENN